MRAAVHACSDRAHDRIVLRTAVELLEPEARLARLRDADLGEQLVGFESRFEEPAEELVGGHLTGAAGTL